jgi:hypothetical protein
MDVKQLYTEKIDTYLSFNAVFRSPQALQAFFEAYPCLHAGLRILFVVCEHSHGFVANYCSRHVVGLS